MDDKRQPLPPHASSSVTVQIALQETERLVARPFQTQCTQREAGTFLRQCDGAKVLGHDGLQSHVGSVLHLLALLRDACRALALFLGLCGRLLGLDPRCQTEAEHASDDAHPVKKKTTGPGS